MITRLGSWMAVFACLSYAGCGFPPIMVVGSGVITGESYDFVDFDRIVAHHAWDVTVLQGEGYAVEISADDNLIQYAKLDRRGSELQIGLSQSLNLQNATLLCVVHVPRLSGASMHGASTLRIGSLSADQLDLEASGASRIEGDVVGGQLNINLSGASRVELTGQAEQIDVDVSGASQANLEQLTAQDRIRVNASGASQAQVHTHGDLTMSATGASNIRFAGRPTILRQKVRGASSIKPSTHKG